MNWIPKIKYTDLLTGIEKEIILNSPPEGDPFNEEYSHRITKTISSNGQEQVQYNYGHKMISLEFVFQSELVKTSIVSFFNTHAIRGGSFDYYPSSDEVDFETYQLDQKSIDFSRPIPTDVEGEFEYNFDLSFKAVL